MADSSIDAPPPLTRAQFYEQALPFVASRYPDYEIETGQMFFNLVFAYEAITNRMGRRMAQFGLTFPSFNVLMILNSHIYRESGCPMSQIGELLLVSKANITGVVDSLERRELVERVDADYDRRVKLARSTAEGTALLRGILPGHFREVKRITRGLTKQERMQLRDLLSKLQRTVLSAGEEPQDAQAR